MLYCLLGCFICTCIFHWGNHRPHPAELVSKLFEPGFLRGPHPNTDLPVPQSPESPFLISFPPCGVHETLILHLPSKPYGFSLPHPSCPPSLDQQARRVSSETIQVRKSTKFIQFYVQIRTYVYKSFWGSLSKELWFLKVSPWWATTWMPRQIFHVRWAKRGWIIKG